MRGEKKDEFFDRPSGHTYGQEWSKEKLEMVKKFAMEIDKKRTSEQRKKIEKAGESCRMEEKGDES